MSDSAPLLKLDPGARALQEEFLRLQQQFMTWQLQAALQQTTTMTTTSSSCTDSAARGPEAQDQPLLQHEAARPLAAHELDT